MHRRISISAISTTAWGLDADLEFYARNGINPVGVSLLAAVGI
jgi:hypothetical protein